MAHDAKLARGKAVPFVTKDGSVIRELAHPLLHAGIHNLSLAEATVPAGTSTKCHRHFRSEEIYHVLQGAGEMHLGAEHFAVEPGDTVIIPPGTPHSITASTGAQDLIVLCCCNPPYRHEDTELIDAC
jgi:mannose-6-phosphate isomerase-like protein (cupin superfamily)